MLRRRHKRHAESREGKESTVQRKKQTLSDYDEDKVEEELEKLVFGGHLNLIRDLETESKPQESDVEVRFEFQALHKVS